MGTLDLMEVTEAARRLDCSASWIRRLVDTGRLAALRTTSGQRLISADAVEALRRQQQAVEKHRQ